MKFFHVYNEQFNEGLEKNGLLNKDSGFKVQHDFPMPEDAKFNVIAAKGGKPRGDLAVPLLLKVRKKTGEDAKKQDTHSSFQSFRVLRINGADGGHLRKDVVKAEGRELQLRGEPGAKQAVGAKALPEVTEQLSYGVC